jgi:uncharacterized protein (TIGR02147 family)
MPIDIYLYDDYRKVLADLWEHRKATQPGLTHRVFAREVGFSNPGFLGDVVAGRRKLSPDAVLKMVRGFGLRGGEAEFFKLLVRHNQTRESQERQDIWRQILGRRSRASFTRMNPALVRYYQDYRYPLVRTALQCMDWRGDSAQLATFVDPPMAPAVATRIANDLKTWGLVVVDEKGRWKPTSDFVEPPPTLGEQVRELNRTWIGHGAEAIARFPVDRRHISTMLLSVSAQTAQEVRRRVETFRSELFELLRADKKPDRVLQLSIQYFPRSRDREAT